MWSLEEMEKSKIKINLYRQELLETERSKEENSPRTSKGAWPYQHLEFGLLASKPLKYFSVVVSQKNK